MKKEKHILKSMTDRVVDILNNRCKTTNDHGSKFVSRGYDFDDCLKYLEFLKKPLTLGIFVATDKEGNILQEPEYYGDFLLPTEEYVNIISVHSNEWHAACEQFEEALEAVLFKNINIREYNEYVDVTLPNGNKFTYVKTHNRFMYNYDKTIEYLVGRDVELTESGARQAGLI